MLWTFIVMLSDVNKFLFTCRKKKDLKKEGKNHEQECGFMQGFRKVDPDRWEFANEGFLRGQRHLLKNIRRRKTTQSSASQQALDACVEVGRFGLDGEVDRLRRDKQVLMMELVKLRHQQQNTREYLQLMEQKLRRTEMKQQHMMSFLARAMQNPSFVQQLAQQKDRRKEFEDMINRKRRRHIDQGPGEIDVGDLGQGEVDIPFVKIEPEEYGDLAELGLSELDRLAMDMQARLSERQRNPDDEFVERGEEHGSKNKFTIDQRFWEDFLNEDVEEEMLAGEGEGDENVRVLVEQLGFLSSSPK